MAGNIYVGKRFGKLTVITLNNDTSRGKSWLCRCDCGKEVILGSCHLLGSKGRRPNRSCGCSQRKRQGLTTKHPKLASVWNGMNQRCYNKNTENYERYGGKGVTVCKEWRDFKSFLDWAIESNYKEGLTLDRIDNSKAYSPENCRWADYYVQEQNRGISKRNTTGVVGVCPASKQGYRAYLTRFGSTISLGVHKSLADAAKARKKAEMVYQ